MHAHTCRYLMSSSTISQVLCMTSISYTPRSGFCTVQPSTLVILSYTKYMYVFVVLFMFGKKQAPYLYNYKLDELQSIILLA